MRSGACPALAASLYIPSQLDSSATFSSDQDAKLCPEVTAVPTAALPCLLCYVGSALQLKGPPIAKMTLSQATFSKTFN